MAVIINGGLNIGNGRTLISIPTIFIDTNFVCVSGAGTPEVNGTYVFNGNITFNGYTRPQYVFGNYILDIQLGEGYWDLYSLIGERIDYYVDNTYLVGPSFSPPPAFPYQVTSWGAFDGQLPVPTFTNGSC